MFLKENVETYVKYAFYVTEALTIYELHTCTHQDMFFLKTQGRSKKFMDYIKEKKIHHHNKGCLNSFEILFARSEKKTEPSHPKTKIGHV
jgi:hypothetical protein